MQDTIVNDFTRYGVELSSDIMKLFSDFLNVVGHKAELISGSVEYNKLASYASKGGVLKQITFDKENLEVMKKCLIDEHVLFSVIGVGDSNNVMCFFRDKDEYKVELAKERFNAILGKGISEYIPDRFLEIYKDTEIGIIKDVDSVNLELMRNHLNDRDVSFTVIKNGENYKILYPTHQQEQIDIALKRTAWDLSSYAANDIKNEIKEKLENRNKVNQLVQDIKEGKSLKEDMVLIDSNNPNRFIQINESGFIMHNLTTETKSLPSQISGRMEPTKVVIDVKSDIVSRNDKDFDKKFYKAINNMSEATVPIKMKNFPLFKGDEDFAVYDKDYEGTQKAFTEELKQIDKIYPKGYTAVSPIEEKVFSIKNITDTEEFELYQALQEVDKDKFYFNNKELAYKEEAKEEIESIIDKVILKKKKTPLERELDKIRLQGNSIDGETYLIIDKDALNQPPVMVSEHNSKVLVLSKENSFNEVATSDIGDVLTNFKHPVVLTVDEYSNYSKMNPDAKVVFIEEKVSKVEENFASDYLKNADKTIKNVYEKETKINHKDNSLDTNALKLNQKVYKNKHLQAALQIMASFAYETISGKQITQEIEKININRQRVAMKR